MDVVAVLGIEADRDVVQEIGRALEDGIVEVAARNHLLMLRGHHAARELNERIQDAIRKSEVPERHLRTAAGLAEVTDHIEDEVE